MTSRGSQWFELIGVAAADRYPLDGNGAATATAALSVLNNAKRVRLDRIISGGVPTAPNTLTITVPLAAGSQTLLIQMDSAAGSHRQRDLFIEIGDGTEGSANFAVQKSVDAGSSQDGMVITFTPLF